MSEDVSTFMLLILTALLISIIGLIINIDLDIGTKSIPNSYVPACDAYFGVDKWETMGMDWVNHDPKFVRDHGDLFYFLTDKNGENGHEYGCINKQWLKN